MRIIRNKEIVDTDFQRIDDEAPLNGAPAIVSLERYLNGENLKGSEKVGFVLEGTDDPYTLPKEALSAPVIALHFPKFSDGRCYSVARILRENLEYSGELRAFGDVMRDQLHLMSRCGINAFEVKEGKSLEDALKAFASYQDPYPITPFS